MESIKEKHKLKAPRFIQHRAGNLLEIGSVHDSTLQGVARLAYKQGAVQVIEMIEEKAKKNDMKGIVQILIDARYTDFYEEIDNMRAEEVEHGNKRETRHTHARTLANRGLHSRRKLGVAFRGRHKR